jgi:hypothetical protein
MQTREPQKRVNWIFVVLLIIGVPLVVITIVMLNTVTSETSDIPENPQHEIPSVHEDTTRIDTLDF